MVVILGGAFQGKLAYAQEHCGIGPEDVFTCSDDRMELDTAKRCIDHLERFALACVRGGAEPKEKMKKMLPELAGSVVICEDIFCGVVPVDPEMRAWREATGRMMNELCRHADRVVRLFCGIPQVLK